MPILQEFLGLFMNSHLILQQSLQQLRGKEITEDMIWTTLKSGVNVVYICSYVGPRKIRKHAGHLLISDRAERGACLPILDRKEQRARGEVMSTLWFLWAWWGGGLTQSGLE